MTNKIVVVDFSGTLIKPFVVEEANSKRYDILKIPQPTNYENKKIHATKKHYDLIKEFIESECGIKDDFNIKYVQNFNGDIVVKGSDIKTMIMTDLFRLCMYMTVKKHGKKIYTNGILKALQKIKDKGYKLAIISGIRTDIISGILAITNCPIEFDFILGQDPVLSKDDNLLLNKQLTKEGKIVFIIGDKLSDILPAKSLKAESIFLLGGHPSGGEEKFADFTIKNASELNKIIK